MESMEAIIDRINEQESRITQLEHRLSPTELRAAEPAPGSDAEHPPVGHRLIGPAVNGKAAHCLYWNEHNDEWETNSDFIAVPIPANEGDTRLTESVAIPVGWKECCFFDHANSRAFGGTFIAPDPSIPWGEGYEAILPSEAGEGASFFHPGTKRWNRYESFGYVPWGRDSLAWRRLIPATTPTEPARDLSDKIAESVVQDLQQACHDRNELRATVERLEAELETTKRFLAESLVVGDRLKKLHDARKVLIEGFRDVLRERLGDLV